MTFPRPHNWMAAVMICVSMTLSSHAQTLKSLRLLGFQPVTGTGWTGGSACLAPTQMALDDIHAYPGLLTGYNLTYKWVDTQCNPGIAVYKMFESLHADPQYVMLLGAGCSIESEATAQVSYLWNLTQLSYGSSSPILSDRKRFPKFFRLAGPDQMLNPARVALLKEFNWKKVATINQALEFFSVVIDDFVQRAQFTNISIISQEIFENDPVSRVKNLKHHDARIILTAMYEDKARRMLCAAYKVGHFGRKIVWVFLGWFTEGFWRIGLEDVGCTADEMEQVVEGSFITGFFFSNPIPERGIGNMTSEEFTTRMRSYHLYNESLSKFDFVTAPCYDHIWATALALNCTETRLQQLGNGDTLDDYTYARADINEVIFRCMSNLSFMGVSGKVIFENGGDPSKNVQLKQIRDGVARTVAIFRMDKSPRIFEWVGDGVQWKGGYIPRDSTFILREEIVIPLAIYVTMSSLASFGIVLAFVFLAFNIYHRENRIVKMSSPNINNILLLGCVMCYITVFLKTTETEYDAICKMRTFCFTLGFTIAFGALFCKTWRVYRIFTNKKLLKRTIKDYQLLVITCAMVSVILVVLVTWEVVSPQIIITRNLRKQIDNADIDAEIHPFVRICFSPHSHYFGWTLYVVEGTLLSFGAFLAWETRRVTIEALNDSKQIGLCLYNVVILSAVGLTLSLLLDEQVVLIYGVTSGCLIIGTTLTQILIFIPKIHAVYRKSRVGVNEGIRTLPVKSTLQSRLDSNGEATGSRNITGTLNSISDQNLF